MRFRLLRILLAVSLAVPAVVSAAVPASAWIPGRPDPFGEGVWGATRPHATRPLAPIEDNFTVLGHLNLPGKSPHGDVFFYDHGGDVGKFAYVGTWAGDCSATGVKIVDVNDPSNPVLVATASTGLGTSAEDMVVRRVGDMDLMAVGVQVCDKGGRPGVALFDVTDPTQPEQVGFSRTPFGGVHELDLVVQPDGRALALLAVPFAEVSDTFFGTEHGGDFRIVDVTDPANPVKLSTWGLVADSDLPNRYGVPYSSQFQGLGLFNVTYDHSVRAFDDGTTAYVSYWDAGVLKFDISDPAAPVLLGRTTYPNLVEGNAHSLTIFDSGGQRYILQNDEVARPPSIFADPGAIVAVASSATATTAFEGLDEFWMPAHIDNPVGGSVFDAGDGCDEADYVGASGMVALADTEDPFYVEVLGGGKVSCRIGHQAKLASGAGATVFVSNLISPDAPYPFPYGTPKAVEAVTGMPVVQVSDNDPLAAPIRAALALGTVTISIAPTEAPWGFIRVYREGAGTDADGDGVTEFSQNGAFSSLPYVTGGPDTPAGDWGVHNTEVLGDHAYSSWYSHGIVALDLANPLAPANVGQFTPRASGLHADIFGKAKYPMVWGVAIDPATGTIYASDMRSGLWIVQPEGDAIP